MIQTHSFNGANQNHLYERKYLGEGRYFQRGVCKGLSVGDEFTCFTEPRSILKVEKLLSVKNGQGNYKDPEDAKNALYEAVLIDESFSAVAGVNYIPLKRI